MEVGRTLTRADLAKLIECAEKMRPRKEIKKS